MAGLERGNEVGVITGPWRGPRGTFEDVDSGQGQMPVVVLAFGRATRLEFDDASVERL